MQVTVRQVSAFLNVSESTVIRWIKQRGLPAQYVAGQYQFHRAELLEWATTNQIKFSLETFNQLDSEETPPFHLADALQGGGIAYQLSSATKDDALRSLVKVLPLPEGTDREFLLLLFLARETAASTAIGDGIALPHVRNPIVLHVSHPLITLGFLEKPVAFGALDGKPVHVLFSLICPTIKSHLQTLARLSYILHDPRLKDVLLRQGSREEILQEIRRVEEPAPSGAVK